MTRSGRPAPRSVNDGLPFAPAKGGLVGRDAELARLRALVGEVAAGRGRSVWVRGEPGIGKTALLAAGLTRVEEAGCQLFVARADELASRIFPLQVLLDALRVGPRATDPGRAEIAQRLWGQGAAGVVSSGDSVAAAAELLLILVDRLCTAGPVVLAVDDLQWADETSLAVWGRLGRSVDQLPLLLVATARPVPQREGIDRLRRSLTGTDPVELQLGPLGQERVAAQVQRLMSVPPGPELRGLLGQAGGNPLYVRELVDALSMERHLRVGNGVVELVAAAQTPVSLAAAIGARLSFLSETATRVLRVAAVLGVEFRVEHLSVVTGRAATGLTGAVEEGMTAGVLAESGTGLVFRHGLIHQALYESIPGPLRHALRDQVARALASAGAPAEAVAEQLLAAPQAGGDWVVDWLAGAAPTLSVRAPHVALDLLQRVRETIDSTDPRRVMLDVPLIDTYFRLGRYDDVDTLGRALLAHTSDPEIVGHVTWARMRAHASQGQFEQALAVAGQALTERAVADRWSARLRALHAIDLSSVARFDEALRTAAQAEADGELAGDRVAVAYALYASAEVQAVYREDNVAALTTIERAAALLGDESGLGDDSATTDLRLGVLWRHAGSLWDVDRQQEAARVIAQAVTLAERAGTPSALAGLRMQSAEYAFYLGRWDDAVVDLEAAATDLPPGHPNWAGVRGIAARIAVHRDDQTTMNMHLRGAEDLTIPTGRVGLTNYLVSASAFSAERDGRPEQALAMLLELLDPESTRQFPHLSQDPDRCLLLIDTVRLAIALSDRAVAAAATEACAAAAKRLSSPVALAAAQHCRGLVQADPTLILSAADAFERISYALFRGHALENAAVLLAQRGDPAAARAAFTQAWQIYSDLDATWDIRRADMRLRPLGIRRGTRGRRPDRPTTGWEALTPTETKIAYLVAAGKSNPDIAAELYLSRNTVQTHVAHILAKLECRSRIDIAVQAMSKR